MKTTIKIAKFSEGDVKKYVDAASTSGSDNGLSANYKTVPIPVIEVKKINNSDVSFGAFVTLLFDDNNNFVKKGAMSINSLQRTFRVAEDWDKLPEDATMEMINRLPQTDLIEGCNRATGMSIFETLKAIHENKQVLVKRDRKKVIQQNFEDGKPCIEGTTVRERNLFEREECAEIYEQLPELFGEIFEEASDKEVEKYFNAAGIDYVVKRK